MAKLGQYNELEVVKKVDFGVFLDGGEEFGEILLPERYMPSGLEVEDKIKVFVYRDSEDRVIATTEKAKAVVGDFAVLEVVSVNKFGVFLDWGLMKDLLLPLGEQKRDLEPGDSAFVRVYIDEKTNRITASQKMDKFLDLTPASYSNGQEVTVRIFKSTELGYSAIINNSHSGLLYSNEIFEPLSIGDQRKAYIQRVREDGKIDLTLVKPGYDKVDSISQDILNRLKEAGGFLALTDKTPPDIIAKQLKMSKKTFKKAIGALYKKKLITLDKEGISLVQ